MIFRIERIADNEIGLVYRDGVFQRVLEAGESWPVRGIRPRTRVHKVDKTQIPVRDPLVDALYFTHPDVVRAHFTVADMADDALGLVFTGGKLADLVGPGTIGIYAKGLRDITVRTIDADRDVEIADAALIASPHMRASDHVLVVDIPSDHVGLLYVDGVLTRRLPPGRHGFVRAVHRVAVKTLDLRLQTLEVTGQDVLTKDRIGIRANVTAIYRISDPEMAVAFAEDPSGYLYKMLQFALRHVVGARTLEGVLGDKHGINAVIAERLGRDLENSGLTALTVGVKDIILPGDVRALMNRVIEAEKNAQANVIKRREETAAARSLLNTAKLMEDNPILLRLKELEALETVSEKVGNVIVGTGMDGVLHDLVRIRPPGDSSR